MSEFAYVIRPTRPTFPGDATEDEVRLIGEHFAYLERLHADGVVRFVGRCEDATFGIAVFEAADAAAAETLTREDPAIAAGVFDVTLHPFQVALS